MTLNIKQELGKRLIFFDGGMGSLLQQNGLGAGELPELWNITHPELILKIHKDYLAAGCDIIKTNTFGANATKFQDDQYSAQDVIRHGVALARRAVEESGRSA